MSTESPEQRSLERVQRAIHELPGALERALAVELPRPGFVPRAIVTSGIGASEGPARWLACTLASRGIGARFVPPTRFLTAAPRGDLLVSFSQGLSPNARLTLGQDHPFRARWLVTSVGFDGAQDARGATLASACDRGVVPIVVPPASEGGMLVRFVGPTVAALVALRLAVALGADDLARALEAAPRLYADGGSSAVLASEPALIAAGPSVDEAYAHRWKILETLLSRDPPVWDVLQVAHGPLQSLQERSATLIALETPSTGALVDRLATTLAPSRHPLVRFRASRDDELAFFEHAAALDGALLATLRAQPRNLLEWPGRGLDAPLYDLGNDP